MCSRVWIVHHKKTHVLWKQTSADCCPRSFVTFVLFSVKLTGRLLFFSKHRIGYLHVCVLWQSSLCAEVWRSFGWFLVSEEFWQVSKMFDRQHNRHDFASFCYTKFPYRNIRCMIILWISWERRASRSVRALLRALFRTYRGSDSRRACVVCREDNSVETMVIPQTHVRRQFFFNCCEFFHQSLFEFGGFAFFLFQMQIGSIPWSSRICSVWKFHWLSARAAMGIGGCTFTVGCTRRWNHDGDWELFAAHWKNSANKMSQKGFLF